MTLSTGAIIGIAVACSIVLVVGLVLLADILHVFWYVRYYHAPRADPAKVAAYRQRMEAAYHDRPEDATEPNPFRHYVTDEEFEQGLLEFQREMDAKGADPGPTGGAMFATLNDAYTKILREAIGIIIAPRAVLLQVAHPFVAVGIKQHSNLVRDTPRRFEKTYLHMFTFAFGTREKALKSARILRAIHNRVTGKFDKDVGANSVRKGGLYSAAHTHALLYVALALADSVLMGYLMMIGELSPKEMEDVAQSAKHGMLLFGVPKSLATGTYEDFRMVIEACYSSDIITIGDEGKEIMDHLLYPKKWFLKPVFFFARWITLAIMPPKQAMEFYGRRASLLEQLAVSAILGVVRFGYRLIPTPMRYIPEYSQAVRRAGKSPWCSLCDAPARVMETNLEWTKDAFMQTVLPSSDERIQVKPGTNAALELAGKGQMLASPEEGRR